MNIFNSIRMRSYLEHLVVGVAVFFVGAGILYGIIEEMVTGYLPESRYAYICGIIASGAMVLCGIVFIFRAFYMDKKIFVHLNTEERQLFFKELNDATTMIFGHRLIITQHFILIYARKFKSFIHLWKLDDLTACYGKAIYSEGVQKPDGYRLVISDERFEPMVCMIKGEAALVMDEAYRAIISLAPWVFTDNFEEFMNAYTRRARKKAFAKEIEHRKAAMHQTEVSDDTLPMDVITAADIIKAFNEAQKKKPKPKVDPKSILQKHLQDSGHNQK